MKSDEMNTFNSFQDLKSVKNKMQNSEEQKKEKSQKRFEEAKKMINQLKKIYPSVFNAEKPLPLAIGIEKEIFKLHPEYAKIILRFALAIWTKRKKYLLAVIAKEHRYNLDGSIANLIKDSEREYSKNKIDHKSLD